MANQSRLSARCCWSLMAGLFAGFGLLLTACNQPSGGTTKVFTPQTKATYVVTQETYYYLDGPQQARPADGTVKPGTEVQLVADEGSYKRVRMPDGADASIAANNLKQR